MLDLIAIFAQSFVIAGAMVLGAALAAAGLRCPMGRRDLPAALAVLFFLVLTQFTTVPPGALTCPVAGAEPKFMPGNSITHVREHVESWGWRSALFKDRTIVAAVMNYLLCIVIGLALAWQGRLSARAILLFGAGMTLTVEMTQITGVWGLYECPYRKFDTDDLILNVAGVATGLLIARRRGWQARSAGA